MANDHGRPSVGLADRNGSASDHLEVWLSVEDVCEVEADGVEGLDADVLAGGHVLGVEVDHERVSIGGPAIDPEAAADGLHHPVVPDARAVVGALFVARSCRVVKGESTSQIQSGLLCTGLP
jgi:hypothetical protein